MRREEIVQELHEVERDLVALYDSRAALQRRVHEMEGSSRQETFTSWAAVQVLMNAFILAIVRCEGLIGDYRRALEQLGAPDNVVQLTCLKGDQDGDKC